MAILTCGLIGNILVEFQNMSATCPGCSETECPDALLIYISQHCPFHLNFGLPLLLQPAVFLAIFVNLSSLIPCICPAHRCLLPTTLIHECFFIPISSLNSPIFLLSSCFTLHILLTQLFSASCSFSCLSVTAIISCLISTYKKFNYCMSVRVCLHSCVYPTVLEM